MSELQEIQPTESDQNAPENNDRRGALRKLGKWSGASVMAAVGAAAWVSTTTTAQAGWLNGRRRGGGWINGGGGGWVNRRGGGGWINRR
jgi:hypothetical protein